MVRSKYFYKLVCICALLSACSQSPKKGEAKIPLAPAPVVTAAPVPAVKQEKQISTFENKLICKNEKDSRSLEILKGSSQGCKLMYSKYGKDQEIASSRNGIDHCKQVLSKVETNLKNGGFECMKVEGAVANKY